MDKTAAINAAVEAYLAKMTPDQVARSNAYFEGGYWIQLWSFFLGCVFVYILMRFGVSAWLRDRIQRWTRFRFLQDCFYVSVYLLINTLFTFPFVLYTDYFREHQYGLSNMDFAGWFGDYAKASAVGLLLFPLFMAVIYILIRKFERSWWVWGSVATTIGLAFVFMIAPVFISPLFNTYKPLSPGPVRDSVIAMAKSNGIPADDVWEFNASKQSNRVSANVSGFMGTSRISLNLAYFSILWLIGFAWLKWGMTALIARFGLRWNVRSVGDIASVPLLIFLFSVFGFVATPVFNTIVRTQEIEADIFGLNLSREPDGEAEVALKLAEYRKMRPSKLEEFIFFDHPSGESRIRTSMTWKFHQEK